MRRILIPALLLTLVGSAVTLASTEGRWLHVRVEGLTGEEAISINLPLSTVHSLLSLSDDGDLAVGQIRLEDHDLGASELREILEALQQAPDSEFITLRSRDETARVAKEDGYLRIEVDESPSSRVRIRLPMAAVEAMLGGPGEQLDVAAGLEALGNEVGDLIVVEDEEETIRIWIDLDENGG